MSTANRVFEWIEAHRDIAFDLVRFYLGVGLFVRGWLLVADSSRFVELVTEDAGVHAFLTSGLAQYIALAHLGGGLLLALGLLTRIAALVQIPILAGAVFLVHLDDGLLAAGQSLEFSALTLFLLVMIVLHGSGRFSLDHLLFERDRVQEVREAERAFAAPPRPAVRAPERAPVRSEARRAPSGCTCTPAHDRTHPRVVAERSYGIRALRFLTGTTGTPREVVFRCLDCGQVVERSRAAADIAYYRYF